MEYKEVDCGKQRKHSLELQFVAENNNAVSGMKIHFSKLVVLTPPDIRPGNLTTTYPNGPSEDITHIYPDYGKLLSIQ